MRIISETSTGNSTIRAGKFIRVLGDVDNAGRMAKVLVSVDDPLNAKELPGIPPLLVGSFVKVEIDGPNIENVIVIPRESLREGEVVWTASPDLKLEKIPVKVVFYRGKNVVVKAEIADGTNIITSSLQTALDGMALELIPNKELNTHARKVAAKSKL